ncbi:MAG: bifunctional ornithine acetyltransferase/N-acetylglutamate synthase [Oscillospiraceae bacterium]|nr:bifunctional ornithine acetyltransferase/N-acetylglutamate synthase [Oscillospiraceae bacterium]
MGIEFIDGGVCAPIGFKAAGVHCGIRKNKEKRDLALIYTDTAATAAAMYTSNLVKGAPLIVTKENIKDGCAKAVICNSGNANTCNADGEEKAYRMCEIVANALSISESDVIVASTGVIGQVLPIEPIESAAETLASELSASGNDNAAEAIMTTDIMKKQVAAEFVIDGKTCRIGGMAKGSGMIHPNMATMLCFITSDVKISTDCLNSVLKDVVNKTFNMVSVDGDTSTNDMVSVLANGRAGNFEITGGENAEIFKDALFKVLESLSRMIASDGEGATHLIECVVSGAKSWEIAKTVSKSVICSSLMKAAIFGADANWGRALCAIGYSGADVDVQKIDVSFKSVAGEIAVCKNGAGVEFSEEIAKKILVEHDVSILVNLNEGHESATAWGCDLTYDYVKINGDYRT